jgi:hypothetical protein
MSVSWIEYGIKWTYPEHLEGSYTPIGVDLYYAKNLLAWSVGSQGYLVKRIYTTSDWEPLNE